MKAIETVYRGYRFRSRLEARWAVFFDEAGIDWRYEHEGIEAVAWDDRIANAIPEHVANTAAALCDYNVAWKNHIPSTSSDEERSCLNCKCGHGSKVVRYLPDFYLPKSGIHVEVKGSDDALSADALRIFEVCANAKIRVVILGDIPIRDQLFGLQFHPIIGPGGSSNSIDLQHGAWTTSGNLECWPESSLNYFREKDFEPERWAKRPSLDSGPFVGTRRAYKSILNAYDSARQARFEHGQVGAPGQWKRAP